MKWLATLAYHNYAVEQAGVIGEPSPFLEAQRLVDQSEVQTSVQQQNDEVSIADDVSQLLHDTRTVDIQQLLIFRKCWQSRYCFWCYLCVCVCLFVHANLANYWSEIDVT